MKAVLGKRVVVVGGETPAGRAVAVGLAEAGADVAIASLMADTKAEFAINSTLNELWALGRRGVALAIDASDAAQLREAVACAEAELGPIDAVVMIAEDIGAASARAALPDRQVLAIAPEADPIAALPEVIEALR